MIGIMAVCGLPLIACTACKPSMPGMRWSMKIASGRFLFKYSMAFSADSAMSTSMSYFSSMRLKMTRADFESSTTNARLRAIPVVYRSRFDAGCAESSAERRWRCATTGFVRRNLWCRLGAVRFLVLRDPRQRRFDIGKLAGGKPFDPDAGPLGFFLGEFGGRDRVYPHQTAAHFSGEFLLLLFGHRSSPWYCVDLG